MPFIAFARRLPIMASTSSCVKVFAGVASGALAGF
nr:MAG TPA: hypothetical protein [Caudoviricetes sp.]